MQLAVSSHEAFSPFLGGSMLLASLAQAQVGVRAGTNLLNLCPKLSSGARPSTSKQLGYQAGISYRQPLTQRLLLVPEVHLSREQAQGNFEDYRNEQNYTRGEHNLHLAYVNVPVLL